MKRPHPNSATCAVKAMADAIKGPHRPPDHVAMRDCDWPFWDAIMCARARDEWLAVDLVVAAQLARCQADIERESAQLDAEGSMLENARGTMVMNPRVSVLEMLARREMAIMRSLRMAGPVARGDPRDEVGRRKLEEQAKALRAELADDVDAELIPT